VADGLPTSLSTADGALTAPSAPDAGVGVAVSVTVTVDKATVTVTGAQPVAAASLSAPPAAPDPEAPPVEAAKTVIYLVEVLVPVNVVVGWALSVLTAPSAPVTSASVPLPGMVAYTVAIWVCLIVVVTTVVLVPDPSVYVSTTDDSSPPDPDSPPDGADVGAGPLFPVPRGTDGVVSPPAAVFAPVAEYEARAAELADSASATGQTV